MSTGRLAIPVGLEWEAATHGDLYSARDAPTGKAPARLND